MVGQIGIPEGSNKQHSADKCNGLGIVIDSDKSGFGIDLKDEHCFVKWAGIEKVVVYKVDLLTIDEVCMDITFNGKTIVIKEEMKGWDTFINQLKSTLRLNNDNWESLVVQKPFECTPMVIYESTDRRTRTPNAEWNVLRGQGKRI